MKSKLLRPLVLVSSICGFAWLEFATPYAILIVRPENLVREYDELRKPQSMVGSIALAREHLQRLDQNQTLGQFMTDKTKGHLVKVSGLEWEKFFEEVSAAIEGRTSRPDLKSRVSDGWMFFRKYESPLKAVTGGLNKSNIYMYIALPSGAQTKYLHVRYEHSPKQAAPPAPTFLVYPYRTFSWWLLLGGLAAYLFWPRSE